MNHHYQAICGRLGRYIQLLRDARTALQAAYEAHKSKVAEYDNCLRYANQRAELYHEWAVSAQKEREHWRKRALAVEEELFTIKINL